MAALWVLLIALSGVAAYLAAGWRIAVRNLPRAWERARSEWGGGFDSQMQRGLIRSSVRERTVAMLLFWPVILTYLTLSARLDRAVDAGDPVRLKAQVAERDARIAKLERELGIR